MSYFSPLWFFSEEHKMLQETVRAFSQDKLAPRIEQLDHEEGFNRDAFNEMGKLGLLGIIVPEAIAPGKGPMMSDTSPG